MRRLNCNASNIRAAGKRIGNYLVLRVHFQLEYLWEAFESGDTSMCAPAAVGSPPSHVLVYHLAVQRAIESFT
jgi:hypothetical protein